MELQNQRITTVLSSMLLYNHQFWCQDSKKKGFWQRASSNHPFLLSFRPSLHPSTHPTVAKADSHPGLLSAVLAAMTNFCQGQGETLRRRWRGAECGGQHAMGQLSAVLVLNRQRRTQQPWRWSRWRLLW